tara:strand:+ start:176 stop:418 length:243 start_codon:yes stop_codon:yes gene_type:complete
MDEKINDFLTAVQELMGEHETEELNNATLVQELMSLSVSNAFIFAVDPDQVDWTFRYIKKEALKKRKELDDECANIGDFF